MRNDQEKISEEYTIIRPSASLFSLNLGEVWQYKDLIRMYVKRNIVTLYKQTILGPLWFIIQPILTTLMFMFVFGRVAGITTDGIPQPVFYFSGLLMWNYFSGCLTANSSVFISNQSIFGKVYFPRLVVPISTTISNLIKFIIQLFLFVAIYLYYYFTTDSFTPNAYALLFPLLLVMMAGLSMGFGTIISSMTTKYRDLTFLLNFGVQLWMYATPIIYPLNTMPADKQWLLQLNPITSIIETFKYGIFSTGVFSWFWLCYSICFMVVLLLLGIIVFNKVERGFMDTV